MRKKTVISLICGMIGCIFMCCGDWLMMYGDTAYEGRLIWLTEGTKNISAQRNALSMLVSFPAIIFYGIGLFAAEKFIKNEARKKVYHYLTVFGLTPWLCLHLFYVMILYLFSWLNSSGYEAVSLPACEALFAQFKWVVPVSEVFMLPPFLYWLYLQIAGKTILPKAMAATNTLIIYCILKLVSSVLPDSPFRLGFINGLMSESMFVWFGVMLIYTALNKIKKGNEQNEIL